jgi:glycogen(starch) synthase
VLGDIASLRELWDGCAVFVSPDSAKDLESAVNDLIRDEKKRGRLAKRARQRGCELTAERMAAQYVSEYDLLGCFH